MRLAFDADGRLFEVDVTREDELYVVRLGDVVHRVDARQLDGEHWSLLIDGRSYDLMIESAGDDWLVRQGSAEQRLQLTDAGRRARAKQAAPAGPERIVSTMPGRVARVLVAEGDAVSEGQGIVVVEAMKMENEIATARGGRVASLAVAAGDTVVAHAVLAVIE
jgi:biotin carboxyl carrier protein